VAEEGYNTILCFIGIAGPELSEQRVAMRVSQGGHDVPTEKLVQRFPRTLANLQAAIRELPNVWIFDNNDLRIPYRLVAVFERGRLVKLERPVPKWLAPLLPKSQRDAAPYNERHVIPKQID
jgi:predicted ABC-type ATPase